MTPIETWYLGCLSTWVAHYQRLPKITELADYCDRSISPTFAAMRSLESKGRVERILVDSKEAHVGERRRFRPIGSTVSK